MAEREGAERGIREHCCHTCPDLLHAWNATGTRSFSLGPFSIERRAMEGPMATGKKVASKASKELSSSKSTKTEKSVAASDLSQAKGKGGPKKGK